ncbi:MAG TPA: hypothetical protein VN911_14455 [Candidatus Acidoferrum sp.]|nr:hypothetical protein [Candidatus Acidoferrum sp.]
MWDFTARLKPRPFKADISAKRGGAAATDEVDDFQAVAVFQGRLRPAVAGDDVAVELDGDAVRFHGQGFDEGGEGEWG